MRRSAFAVSAMMALSVVMVQGCQRLNEEQNVTLGVGEVKGLSIEPPRSEQKVTVTVTSSASPVDVYVVLDPNRAAVSQSLEKGMAPEASKVLASQKKVQEASLEATIPAKTAYAVVLAGATKDTQVKLKIQGR